MVGELFRFRWSTWAECVPVPGVEAERESVRGRLLPLTMHDTVRPISFSMEDLTRHEGRRPSVGKDQPLFESPKSGLLRFQNVLRPHEGGGQVWETKRNTGGYCQYRQSPGPKAVHGGARRAGPLTDALWQLPRALMVVVQAWWRRRTSMFLGLCSADPALHVGGMPFPADGVWRTDCPSAIVVGALVFHALLGC